MALNYLPRTDEALEAWLRNFATKLPAHAGKYVITPAEIADVTKSVTHFAYQLQATMAYTEYNKKQKKFLKELKEGLQAGATIGSVATVPNLGTAPPATTPGFMLRVKSLVNRIKSNINYTVADGLDLGIESTATKKAKPNVDTIKPMLKIKLSKGGQPEIIWTKSGMDAIEIWVKRANDDNFTLLNIDTKPNYIDKHPLPEKAEHWQYKAIYRLDDGIVGHWSDIISTTVVRQHL